MSPLGVWSPSSAPAAAASAAATRAAELAWDGALASPDAEAPSRVLRAPADGAGASPQALTARFLACLLAPDAGG
ncbi:hypothetical protein [Rubrivivax gelatinosus]|uniref:hypothetical protein n=1 Tax=Rubrivivax gelatinosus TaxID=28068 RepID=UPI001903D725|nr:hypothetical protein [Rubrivivax gelatinosus]